MIKSLNVRRMALDQTNLRFMPVVEGKPYQFEGYAVKWATINSHGEQFLKGAFADLIASGKKIHMYYNHYYADFFAAMSGNAYRIGKWLELREDDEGLFVRGELTPGLDLSDRVGAMLQHGTIDGFSIAYFDPNPMDTVYAADHVLQIKRVDLYEISVVDEPSDRMARTTAVDSAEGGAESAILARLNEFAGHGLKSASADDTAANTAKYDGLTGLIARLS